MKVHRRHVYWITGKANSGKTTLALKLKEQLPLSKIIEGETVREETGNDMYNYYGIYTNMAEITLEALDSIQKGFDVIIACVSPIRALRKKFQKILSAQAHVLEIQLPGGIMWKKTTYEE